MKKKHSQNSGTGREWKNPFPHFGNRNQRLSFPGTAGNGNRREREFPLTPAWMRSIYQSSHECELIVARRAEQTSTEASESSKLNFASCSRLNSPDHRWGILTYKRLNTWWSSWQESERNCIKGQGSPEVPNSLETSDLIRKPTVCC